MFSDSFPQGRSTVQEGIFPGLLVNKIDRTVKELRICRSWMGPRICFFIRSVRVSEKYPSIDGRQSLKARRDITHFEEEKEAAIVATDEDDRRKPLHRHCGYFSTFEPKRESFPDTFSSRTDRYFD